MADGGGGATYTMSHETYEFKDTTPAFKGGRKSQHLNHHHHRRQSSASGGQSVEDSDPTDGTGSLTYSATSSVQSGASAGESTDSSFADIMRVLDLQDGPELAALMKKEGISSASELRDKHRAAAAVAAAQASSSAQGHNNHHPPNKSSGVSVASSLNYSTDGESALESALEGSHLLHTITGQPSDSYAFDGGGIGTDKSRPSESDDHHHLHDEDDAFSGGNNILFAPAEPAEVKRKKKGRTSSSSSIRSHHHHLSEDTPRAKNGSGRRAYDDYKIQPSAPSPTTVTSKSVATPSTPPSLSRHLPRSSPGGGTTTTSATTKKRNNGETTQEDIEEEEAWYAKWWISCFPDAFRELLAKR